MNRRTDWFLMRVNDRERELIATLAQREGTSASEAVRSLIRRAVETNEPRSKSSADVAEARSFISGA